MTPTEVLVKTRARLEDPKLWFQGRLAEDWYYLGEASSMCVRGTVQFVIAGTPFLSELLPDVDRYHAVEALALETCMFIERAVGRTVPSWNDGDRTHKDILEGLDKAIKLSRGD